MGLADSIIGAASDEMKRGEWGSARRTEGINANKSTHDHATLYVEAVARNTIMCA